MSCCGSAVSQDFTLAGSWRTQQLAVLLTDKAAGNQLKNACRAQGEASPGACSRPHAVTKELPQVWLPTGSPVRLGDTALRGPRRQAGHKSNPCPKSKPQR